MTTNSYGSILGNTTIVKTQSRFIAPIATDSVKYNYKVDTFEVQGQLDTLFHNILGNQTVKTKYNLKTAICSNDTIISGGNIVKDTSNAIIELLRHRSSYFGLNSVVKVKLFIGDTVGCIVGQVFNSKTLANDDTSIDSISLNDLVIQIYDIENIIVPQFCISWFKVFFTNTRVWLTINTKL